MIDFPGDTITAVSQTVKYGNVVQKSNGRHREKFVDKEQRQVAKRFLTLKILAQLFERWKDSN